MASPVTIRVGPAPHIALDVIGQGPLVVFLHGIGGNRTNWRRQLPVFAERFTAAAWDARGYGDSDDYPGPLDFADFSKDLLRVLDYFGAEKAHLVGLSMGGRIALDFYGRYPDRVRSLVLADTSVGRRSTPEEVEEFLRVRRQPLLDGKTPAEIAPEVAKTLTGPSTPPDKLALILESLSALRTQSYLKTLEAVTHYAAFPALGSVKVPCLVLVGAEDRLVPLQLAQAMAGAIPGAQLVVLERTAHMSNIESPEAFSAAVLSFLLQGAEAAA
jgi:3-oxoadipate enol-lactonase